MMLLGRLQIGRPTFGLLGYGWRRVCWGIFWKDRELERECLERAASLYDVRPLDRESNESLRERILYVARWRGEIR